MLRGGQQAPLDLDLGKIGFRGADKTLGLVPLQFLQLVGIDASIRGCGPVRSLVAPNERDGHEHCGGRAHGGEDNPERHDR